MANSSSDPVPRPDGLVLAPFRALRYDPRIVMLAKVLAPPYDVIDDAERADLEARDDHNIVRLTLPREEPGADSRYDAAAVRLAEWRAAGILRPDAEPSLHMKILHAEERLARAQDKLRSAEHAVEWAERELTELRAKQSGA